MAHLHQNHLDSGLKRRRFLDLFQVYSVFAAAPGRCILDSHLSNCPVIIENHRLSAAKVSLSPPVIPKTPQHPQRVMGPR